MKRLSQKLPLSPIRISNLNRHIGLRKKLERRVYFCSWADFKLIRKPNQEPVWKSAYLCT